MSWYPITSEHQLVYDFLRLHCRSGEQLEKLASDYAKTHPHSKHQQEVLTLGLVSKQQLLEYLHAVSDKKSVGVGNLLARIYDRLVEWHVFGELPFGQRGMMFDFKINFTLVDQYERKQVLENIVKGPVSLVPRYSQATAAIIIEKGGDESLGSGSLVAFRDKTYILTNKHVVDPAKNIKIKKIHLGGTETTIPTPQIVISDSDDLAAFEFSAAAGIPRFFLGDISYPLQDVILFGYPKIPHTIKPEITAHKGEINATIQTRSGEELFLISNYASPGSSGGPLIDQRGLLFGVVSDSLEAEYAGDKKMFQHSAAVTLRRVHAFLENRVGRT